MEAAVQGTASEDRAGTRLKVAPELVGLIGKGIHRSLLFAAAAMTALEMYGVHGLILTSITRVCPSWLVRMIKLLKTKWRRERDSNFALRLKQ
jgi:hypothetical protein